MKRFLFFCSLFLLLFSCKTQGTEKPQKEGTVKSDNANIISYVIKDKENKSHSFRIDNAKGTVILTLAHDHSVSLNEVSPTIVVSKGATISPASGQVCDFSSKDKTVSYTVTSESGKTKQYIASVEVLEKRKDLEVESIKVYGVLVKNNSVTIDEKYSIVKKENIEVKFKGVDTPSDFSITPEFLRLNNKEDVGMITLSTPQTDRWNAWSKTITVKRGGEKHVPSKECSILKFVVNNKEGNIDENNKTIKCEVPESVKNTSIIPTIECSAGAFVSPASGVAQDFSKGPVSYTVTAEDGSTTKTYEVTVVNKKSTEAKIISFSVGNVNGIINENVTPKTIKVLLEHGADLSKIIPTIVVSEGATLSPASNVVQDFSEGKVVKYTVTSESGGVNTEYNVTVKMFPPKTNIKIFGVDYIPTGNGKGKVVIPKDKDKIELKDIKITYQEGSNVVEILEEKFQIEGDQTNLVGETGTMTLKIILNLGPSYISNATMTIEVTKQA